MNIKLTEGDVQLVLDCLKTIRDDIRHFPHNEDTQKFLIDRIIHRIDIVKKILNLKENDDE